ncbi:MAG: FtsQ-type POTRA domain-containing protein [Patescibacteria group bacterium]
MNRTPNQNAYRNPKVFNLPFEPPKKKRRVKLYKPILILILLGGIYYFIFQSPYFQIKNIIVDQNMPPQVTQYLAQYKGQNIFTFQPNAIRDNLLAKYPELVSINVARGIPDAIKVTFSQRSPVLVWQTGAQFYLVDALGTAYIEVSDPGGLIVVKDNKSLLVKSEQQVVTDNFIKFVSSVKSKLDANGLPVDHFEINETTFQVDAALKSGILIKFDITRSVDDQMSELTAFLKDHANEATQYIDLRVAGKVFYK